MSFDRPGLPDTGQPSDRPEVEEILTQEGVDLTEDGDLQPAERPGEPSEGPTPEPPD